jgi:hypothetical protein
MKQTHPHYGKDVGFLVQPRHGEANCRHSKSVISHRLSSRTKKLVPTPWSFLQHPQLEEEIDNLFQVLTPIPIDCKMITHDILVAVNGKP